MLYYFTRRKAMKEIKKFGLIISALLFSISLVLIAQEQPNADNKNFDVEKAKTKYVEAKCNTCHSVSAYGIEKKNKSANNKAPDFSEIKVEYDKEFLKKYLNKEEQINNKKHPVAFKGTDEDVELIIGLILHNVPKNEDNKQE